MLRRSGTDVEGRNHHLAERMNCLSSTCIGSCTPDGGETWWDIIRKYGLLEMCLCPSARPRSLSDQPTVTLYGLLSPL